MVTQHERTSRFSAPASPCSRRLSSYGRIAPVHREEEVARPVFAKTGPGGDSLGREPPSAPRLHAEKRRRSTSTCVDTVREACAKCTTTFASRQRATNRNGC